MSRATAALLRQALTAVLGVDAILALRDIAGLNGKAIEDTLVWMASTLVGAAMASSPP